uniref:hypothetical protein n=1 Tax=Patulibacter defluvii TaxID=3095358 RepID=UPI002A760355
APAGSDPYLRVYGVTREGWLFETLTDVANNTPWGSYGLGPVRLAAGRLSAFRTPDGRQHVYGVKP